MCLLSHVTYHLLAVTCHLSPFTNANSHGPLANSTAIHSRVVCKDLNIKICFLKVSKIIKTLKKEVSSCNISNTLFDQKSPAP